MKKRLSILLLVAVVAVAGVLLAGCGGMTGDEITADEFVTALESYTKKVSEGNFGMEAKISAVSGGQRMEMSYDIKVEGSKKLYIKMSMSGNMSGVTGSTSVEAYYDSTGTTSYVVMNDGGQWKGAVSDESISEVIDGAFTSIGTVSINKDQFDKLEYKNGRYYLKTDAFEDDATGECYYVFKDGKFIGAFANMKVTENGVESTMKIEMKLSYDPTVTIPSYTK